MNAPASSGTRRLSGGRNTLLIFGIILIGANLRAPITSVGPVLADIQEGLHLSGEEAGILNALPLLVFAVLSLLAPLVAKRHGMERVLGAALAAVMAGTVWRSTSLPAAIWLGTLLLSGGIAFGNVLLPAIVKRDFPERATWLISLYAASMAGMAGIASGLAVPLAGGRPDGWRWAIGAWALLAAFALLLWMPQIFSRQHRLAAASKAPTKLASPWTSAIGWQVSLFFALHSLIFYSLIDWYPSYARAAGTSTDRAGLYLLAYQVVAIGANLTTASIIRRQKNQVWLGIGCAALIFSGVLGLTLYPPFALLWLIAAGLGAGVAMVTSLSLFGLRTHNHEQAAALSGMGQFVGYAGAGVGPFMVGLLHEATGSWIAPFVFLLAAALILAVIAPLAGRARLVGSTSGQG